MMQQNFVTLPSYCHECVKDMQRYLWYKFQVNSINTTNVIMILSAAAKVTPQASNKNNSGLLGLRVT